MKVSVLVDSISRNAGGIFDSVRRLCQIQARLGDEISVHTVEDEFTGADRSAWEPIRVSAFRRLGPSAFGYAPGLIQDVVQTRPDIIHSHGMWKFTSVVAIHAAARLHCPRIIHTHGMVDPWALNQSRAKKLFARFAYENRNLRNAACIRALTHAELRVVRALGFRGPVAVIPNGVDVEPLRTQVRQSVSAVLPGRKVLLYLGRIHPKKGLMNLLRAWAEVTDCHLQDSIASEWVLVIAGWDQHGHEHVLRQLCGHLALGEDRVCFVGPQFGTDKATWYERCDAFVLPSFSEGLPMVVLEAWAHAKPVIITPSCNLPQGDQYGASIVSEPDEQSLAGALKRMLSMTQADREGMGSNGIRLVEECFSWLRVGQQMQEVNDWAVGGRAVPDCVCTV
jgi:glycosyltransferase involved in cell wall biosynthesis